MQEIIIPIVALLASLLTFFSGFGLGTLLMPVFAIFYPVEIAIALTGIVHLLNNLFKIGLVFKNIKMDVALRFGIPALLMALVGAFILTQMTTGEPYHTYEWKGMNMEMTTTKTIIGALMILFAIMEITPALNQWHFGKKHLMVGGALSGFFGGISGHQGALRSMFLLKSGLTKEQFIATGVTIACAVDIGRLGVYWGRMQDSDWADRWQLLTITVLAAFVGAYFGKKLLTKVTISALHITVSILISVMGVALIMGLL
jgi:uncharacterized protein